MSNEEQLVIAPGKYRTRCGDVAVVTGIGEHGFYPVYGVTGKGALSWTLRGTNVSGVMGCFDLIERIEDEPETPQALVAAPTILTTAADTIGQRGTERDQPSGERSMGRAVAAFNALTGHALTEVQGWQFMAVLKLARANGGRFNLDDYVDGAAYMGLTGEAAAAAARDGGTP